MSNEVEQAQAEVIEEFAFLDDWMDRYQYIIDMGKRLQPLPDDERVDDNLIRGCQSRVWMIAETVDDRLSIRAISDAAIVSGLIAILLRIYSGRRPQDILDTSPDFVASLGLEQHLSPTRSNGLASMLKAIRRYAGEAVEAV
ncbi:MAG: SufE family protein [Pseudomonadota bacterium]